MSNKIWTPRARYIAQSGTVTVTLYDAATTYTLTINDVAVSAVGDTDAPTTAENLRLAWQAQANAGHPYFSTVSCSRAAAVLTFTANTASVPFTVTSGATGGTGTIGAYTAVTANSSPHAFDQAENWHDGALPSSSDTIYFAGAARSCLWGLDQSALTGVTIIVDNAFLVAGGRIGLPKGAYTTSADGNTRKAGYEEYRQHSLKIDASSILIGAQYSPTAASPGASFISIENTRAGASTLNVRNTGRKALGTDANLDPAVLYKAAHASATVNISRMPGGVGLHMAEPGETGTVGAIVITNEAGPGENLVIGQGTTLTSCKVNGGHACIRAAATVTALASAGAGSIDLEGDAFTVTSCTVNGSKIRMLGAQTITTCVVDDGCELDASQTDVAKTITTLQIKDGTLRRGTNLTIGATNYADHRAIQVAPL